MRANAIWSLLTFGGGVLLAIVGSKIQEHETFFYMLAAGCFIGAIIIWAWPFAWRSFGGPNNSAHMVGAIDAFKTILSKSKWVQKLRKNPEVMKRGPYEISHTADENIQRRLDSHLDTEFTTNFGRET